MSNSSNNPGPPPDDFSKTVPNVKVPDDIGAVDWDKTNYNIPKQPVGEISTKSVKTELKRSREYGLSGCLAFKTRSKARFVSVLIKYL